MAVAAGDVYGFTARRRWYALQIVEPWLIAKHWRVVAFAVSSRKRPGAEIVDGAPIYVIRHGQPRNQPLHVYCQGEPSASLTFLGNRPVALAFELPYRYRTSPRAGEDKLPLWTTWTYPQDRIEHDVVPTAPAYRSRRFKRWTEMDPRAHKAIDEAVTAFAAVKPATEAALRKAVRVGNRHQRAIDTVAAEELSEALIAIARRNRMSAAVAATVIDATREW
jgi:hypothetical protein